MEPHALCLTVFLSKTSFSQTTYKDRRKMDVKHDLKIDVYFNGQFFNSQIMGVGQLHYTGSRGIKVRMHRFTGQRLSRFIEKPWIFVPPGHQLDGSKRASPPVHRSMSGSVTDADANQQASSSLNASIPECAANAEVKQQASASVDPLTLGDPRAGDGTTWRWTTISNRLKEEVDRVGRDKHGERPVTGDYLDCLASLPAPPEMGNMQKDRGATFGIIDVVVIWGKGQKDAIGSKYLTEPTRLRLKSYSAECNGGTASEETQRQKTPIQKPATNLNGLSTLTTSVRKVNNVSTTAPAPSDQSDAPAPSELPPQSINIPIRTQTSNPNMAHTATVTTTPQPLPPPKTRAEALATALPVDGSGDDPLKPTALQALHKDPLSTSTSTTRHTSTASTRKSTPKRSRDTSVSSEMSNRSRKKQRIPYYHILTAKQTYAEEMESIVEQAVEEAEMLTARASLRDADADANAGTAMVNDEPLSAVAVDETPPTPSKIVTLKVSPQKLATSPLGGAGVMTGDGVGASDDKQGFSSSNAAVVNHSLDADFVPPALSEGCCVTFAERGVVRSVGAIRGGWFEEGGVVMGTRFIVG